MKIIVGLGNYGKQYENTRHNIGFMVVDKLAYDNNVKIDKKKFKSLCAECIINGEKCILVKPQTYMNLSGDAVAEVLAFYKPNLEDIIVIYDDTSFDVGEVRVKRTGSSGGQNGIRNIIARLGTEEINRVRCGIGSKPPKMNLADYVLSRFLKEENDALNQGITKASLAVEDFVTMDIEKVMTKYNSKDK